MVGVLAIGEWCDGKCEGDISGRVCLHDMGRAADLLEASRWAESDVDRGAADMLDVLDAVAAAVVEEGGYLG